MSLKVDTVFRPAGSSMFEFLAANGRPIDSYHAITPAQIDSKKLLARCRADIFCVIWSALSGGDIRNCLSGNTCKRTRADLAGE